MRFRPSRWLMLPLLLVIACTGHARTPDDGGEARTGANVLAASALLAVDQNRATIVERIVADWGDRLVAAGTGVSKAQLKEMLTAMRADQLLAASLAGSLDGLKSIFLATAPGAGKAKIAGAGGIVPGALGDASADLVYTPVTPCRLFDTRASQGGLGTPTPGTVRTYGAITPVAKQGGPGNCAAASGATVALFVVSALTPSGLGLLQGGPQGTTNFPNALILYQPGDQYSVTVAMPLNPANGQFDLLELFAQADLTGDLLGYFRAPANAFVQNGNAFGASAKLGTQDNFAVEVLANNARVMRYEPNATSPNVVGGHAGNAVSAGNNIGPAFGQTIAGGGSAGDCPDSIANPRSCANQANGAYSTVSGGQANTSGGIGGQYTAVAGGYGNASSAPYSTVGGGRDNTASGSWSTVAGGDVNTAGTDKGATVSGGIFNQAVGDSSTVSGGWQNFAGGPYSTVVGGQFNNASGQASVAMGSRAQALFNGCFVFSDLSLSNPSTQCSAANQFVARAFGGVKFFTGYGASYIGAQLLPGSTSWTVVSDRATKNHVTPVESQDVLEKVVAMPISTWNWITQPESVRHMGPMAQDFHAAFGLGEMETGISTVDAQGVALAAIQGLNAKLVSAIAERDARLAKQEHDIAELRRAVEALVAGTPGAASTPASR